MANIGGSRIKLNNGIEMPAVGLGVLGRATRELTADAVQSALTVGYRLVDTAASYLNESLVGEGIRRSGIDRSEVFLTTKLWMTKYGRDDAMRAFESSLRKLGVDYLDMYMLHWPVPSDFDKTAEAYGVLEKLLSEGRIRAIGVANFDETNLKVLAERCQVTPAVNQVELHPRFAQPGLCQFHKAAGIVTQAWSPLGGSVRMFNDPNKYGDPLENKTVLDIATKYGKTSAQVVLRWHLQHGISAIPKSFRAERIKENFDIFDFELTSEEMAAINQLDTGLRSGPDPQTVHASSFPIAVED
jgi:diketogulonate reductase-like aldo/keto reductase